MGPERPVSAATQCQGVKPCPSSSVHFLMKLSEYELIFCANIPAARTVTFWTKSERHGPAWRMRALCSGQTFESQCLQHGTDYTQVYICKSLIRCISGQFSCLRTLFCNAERHCLPSLTTYEGNTSPLQRLRGNFRTPWAQRIKQHRMEMGLAEFCLHFLCALTDSQRREWRGAMLMTQCPPTQGQLP